MQTADYEQAPRLPDSPPRVRGFLNKKQQSEQETTKAADHCSAFLEIGPFWGNFWKIMYFYAIWDKTDII